MKQHLAIFACFILLSCQQKDLEIVDTRFGPVKGYTKDDLHIFKGIPFAQPPVGDLRWKAPQEPEPWTKVKECTSFGPSPMQAPPQPFRFWSSEFLIPESPIGEDCLYLNVWTRAKSSEEKRPVLVYIYGGGFRSGGAGCAIYDGESMAKRGVVFVTLNYRVGTFGFFAHPELTKESGNGASGNYGIMDQIAALRWVKDNIASFGGDPENVTIAGQSAGSFAVNILVASPRAQGLFQKAIGQSGGSVLQNPARPAYSLSEGEQMGLDFAAQLNCTSLAELRAKSAEEILNAPNRAVTPIVDGFVLPQSVHDIFYAGKQNDVATIVGWNQDDRVSGPPMAAAEYRKSLESRMASFAADFLAQYPDSTEEISARSQIDIGRDEVFGAQNYAWAKKQSELGKSPVYIYNFNRDLPYYTDSTNFGAFHSGEIVYAYDNLHTLDRPWKDEDHKLAEIMSSYWVNFATKGDPNGDGLPEWPVYKLEDEQVMILDVESKSAVLPDKNKLMLWEKFFSQPPASEQK